MPPCCRRSQVTSRSEHSLAWSCMSPMLTTGQFGPAPVADTWKWLLSILIGAVMGLFLSLTTAHPPPCRHLEVAAVHPDRSGDGPAGLPGGCWYRRHERLQVRRCAARHRGQRWAADSLLMPARVIWAHSGTAWDVSSLPTCGSAIDVCAALLLGQCCPLLRPACPLCRPAPGFNAGGFLAPYLTHVGISLGFALVAGGLVRWVHCWFCW